MIPRHAHKRSLSSEHRALSPEKTVTKAKSTTDLTQAASHADANSTHPQFEENNFNTLQDPRLAAGTEVSPSTSSSPHHPDLSNEVAALSVKLIQAINNQTTLDDSLVATRQELEVAQGKIIALEFQNEKYRRDIDQQIYIKKSDSDREIQQLKAALAEERTQRAAVEKGKKTIEQELETLTADLFEEANKVSSDHRFLKPTKSPEVCLTSPRWLPQRKSKEKRWRRRMSNYAHKLKTPSLSSHRIKINWLSSNRSCKGCI